MIFIEKYNDINQKTNKIIHFKYYKILLNESELLLFNVSQVWYIVSAII